MHDLLEKSNIIAKTIKASRLSRSLSRPVSDLAPPSRVVANTMATLYFQSFESTHRILHISAFWAEYERYWILPEDGLVNLRLKILLVIALGASLHERIEADVQFRKRVHQWIYAAKSGFSDPWRKFV